jgi:hypothetical protein
MAFEGVVRLLDLREPPPHLLLPLEHVVPDLEALGFEQGLASLGDFPSLKWMTSNAFIIKPADCPDIWSPIVGLVKINEGGMKMG